jgi:ferredoxin-NADP reductase
MMCTGITPMRSILHELLKRGRQATLLYSARAATEAPFLDEFRSLEAAHPDGLFRLVFTVTGDDPGWNGPRGRVNKALIAQQVCHPAHHFLVPLRLHKLQAFTQVVKS